MQEDRYSQAPYPVLTDDVAERFWAKVNKTETCWLWTASKRNKGYGAFAYNDSNSPVNGRAHCISYKMYKGPIPPGLFVLHTCDNPACINPEHLFLGTKADNNKDMCQKGRHVAGGTYGPGKYKRGEEHHNARLSDAIVKQMRVEYDTEKPKLPQLAAKYGVQVNQVRKIVYRRAWKHVC